MKESIVQHSSSSSSIHQYEMRITRSMTKSARPLVGGNNNNNGTCISLKNPQSSAPYTNHQVSSKNRKTKKMKLPFLPEEIIFQIFLLLPARVLHDVMRKVCGMWRKVIRDPVFIKAHLSRSPVTLLDFVCTCTDSSYFRIYLIDFDQTTWKFNETARMQYVKITKQIYMGHGDGLLLTYNRDLSNLYLINPLTKQIVTLPRLPVGSLYSTGSYAVGCSPSTRKCKVVFNHRLSMTTYILTVGVDKKWRKILVESSTTSMPLYKLIYAQGIWGFIYWHDDKSNHLIALDVEKEVFYKVGVPEEFCVRHAYHTSSDRFLSFAVKQYSHLQSELVGVVFWELVSCKNGGEWRKLRRVDFESKRKELNEILGLRLSVAPSSCITPVAVLNTRDVAIFQFAEQKFVYIAYNFKTGMFCRWFDSPLDRDSRCIFWHVNSLVVL